MCTRVCVHAFVPVRMFVHKYVCNMCVNASAYGYYCARLIFVKNETYVLEWFSMLIGKRMVFYI